MSLVHFRAIFIGSEHKPANTLDTGSTIPAMYEFRFIRDDFFEPAQMTFACEDLYAKNPSKSNFSHHVMESDVNQLDFFRTLQKGVPYDFSALVSAGKTGNSFKVKYKFVSYG